VNLTGTFRCMHAVLPSMRARRDGLIINVASWAGRHASSLVGPGYLISPTHNRAFGA
jgi:NADP-dependent 3-hydroxy acid dehydrogenase YdfG